MIKSFTAHADLCFAVYTTSQAFSQAYRPLFGELGLTWPQYLVLLVLNYKDGSTVKELGEGMLLESNTLSPLLKRMEISGFVRRHRDQADERLVRVWLTELGRQTLLRAEESARLGPRGAGQPSKEMIELNKRIEHLWRALHRANSPPAEPAEVA